MNVLQSNSNNLLFSDDEGRGRRRSSSSLSDLDTHYGPSRRYHLREDNDDDDDYATHLPLGIGDEEDSFERLHSPPKRESTSLGGHHKPPPGPPPGPPAPLAAFPAPDSLSTISVTSADKHQPSVKEVYRELTDINAKLKEEFRVLAEKDKALKVRERRVQEREANISRLIDEEVIRRMALNQAPSQQRWEREVGRLEGVVKEKTRENKRLQDNFNTVKSANDVMRKEMEHLQQQHDKLEKQSNSLQARLVNLQRKKEHEERKAQTGLVLSVVAKNPKRSSTVAASASAKDKSKNVELVAVLLEWLADVHIKQMLQPEHQQCTPDVLYDKFLKILPSLVEQLKGTLSTKLALPTLQFLYWALLHIEQPTGKQALRNTTMTSSLRRLGEELYRGSRSSSSSLSSADLRDDMVAGDMVAGDAVARDTGTGGTFFRSPDLEVRLLSSLIILMSISQVDHLAHVLEVLRNDLKQETCKELFLRYQATPVLFPLLKPGHKALHCGAVDVYLALSTESPLLSPFLSACSGEPWFRAVSLLWRLPGTDTKLLEKLSIILQKLSKIKSTRRYFEVFGLTQSAQELLRSIGADKDMAFLALNLKSILFNLNVSKGSAVSL